MEPVARNTVFKAVARPALATSFLLLIPLVAMRLTPEVVWDAADFVVAGALLFGAGVIFELVARKAVDDTIHRVAIGTAVLATLALIWVNLAVGMIGTEDNPANLMYLAVLAVGLVGVMQTRFRPPGMAVTMLSMALVQVVIAAIALVPGWINLGGGPLEVLLLNGFFVLLFAASALLFWRAARQQPEEGLN
jgi:hypothetical protein